MKTRVVIEQNRRTNQLRISVSLPSDLSDFAREMSIKYDIPVSRVVAEAIRQMRTEDLRAQIIEGLLEDART